MRNLSLTESDIGQLKTLWKLGCTQSADFPGKEQNRRSNDTFYCKDFFYDESDALMNESARQTALNEFKSQLLTCSKNQFTHFTSLDSALSERIICQYQESPLDPKVSDQDAVRNAHQLLTRLPAVPLQIDLTSHLWGDPSTVKLPNEYLNQDVYIDENSVNPRSPWSQLQVVSRISTVTLKLALLVTNSDDGRRNLGLGLRSFVDFISRLLDAGSSAGSSDYDILGNSIVDAFLWTTWQRSLMLHYWFILKTHLVSGYNSEWDTILALRGCVKLSNPSVRATLHGSARQNHDYMCPWAFQLLRSSRVSLGLDFRRFHEHFSTLHRGKGARCQFESSEPCDGSHPLSCGRFLDKRLVQGEQSLHDESCSGSCKKICWDAKSYTKITGPTAISLKGCSAKVRYTQANEDTLAISHVWSHGQGSRPHAGINKCLHKRYIGLAKSHGCTSYWIDSMCIPSSHELRTEAIGFINRIFATSKITLVCDKDLMAVDISNLTRDLIESVLSSFFVCDWNVRAWTLLEAMKGSHAIYILCRFNKTISLRDALIEIHQFGSVDISILCLTAQHLIPSSTEAFRRSSSRQSTEVSGSLLSHRHATRDNDDIVIWSLLSTIHVYHNAEDMWRSKIGHRIATAYLLSNTPRLEGTRGFSWAPKTPYIRIESEGPTRNLLGPYHSFEGSNSELGQITPRGLLAEWLVYYIALEDALLYQDSPVTMTELSVTGERKETVLPGHKTINNCWSLAQSFCDTYEHVILIQPRVNSRSVAYNAANNRGETHGDVFAICVSQDEDRWTWKSVQAWPRSISSPPFFSDTLLIE
ncbi:hypothetical protein HYFRA_00011960 [Hymenoscyphus fraxineus]|uniref:Heterokaryon incompatibility domain-containing protein n=1 Tax=Hymenoscyphus fraxineus TaxID=746836 RepID=A0A9N9L030_9HELO|nr:hypothetical protein HYFRA_00011960 [Hymenoscyphus fraxineus]